MSCPICGGSLVLTIPPDAPPDPGDPRELAFRLRACPGCSLVGIEFLMEEPGLSRYIDDFHENLFSKMNRKEVEKGLKLFRERASRFADRTPGRVLDIGCERGYFLKAMAEAGWQAIGLEPLEPFAAYARDELGVEARSCTLQRYEGEADFDLITLWHVLEHLEDPVDALGRARDLLAAGGVIHFEVPNIDSMGRYLGGKYWMGFRDPTHRWFFRRPALGPLAESAGLEIVQVESGPSPAAWYSLKRALFGRVYGREHWRVQKEGPRHPPGALGRLLYRTLGFYPVAKSLGLIAGGLGYGEVINVTLRRARQTAAC